MNDKLINREKNELQNNETPWERGIRLARERKLKLASNVTNNNSTNQSSLNEKKVQIKTVWKIEEPKKFNSDERIPNTPKFSRDQKSTICRSKYYNHERRSRSKNMYKLKNKRELPDEFKHREANYSPSNSSSSSSSRSSSSSSDSYTSNSSADSYEHRNRPNKSKYPRNFRSRSPVTRDNRRSTSRSPLYHKSMNMYRTNLPGKENVKHVEERQIIRYGSESPIKTVPVIRKKILSIRKSSVSSSSSSSYQSSSSSYSSSSED